MSNFSIEVIRRVYDDNEGVYLTVGPWPDEPSFLALYVEGTKNKEWYGDINMSLSDEQAYKLGKALLDAAVSRGYVESEK